MSTKVLAVGALATVCATGGVLANAHAAPRTSAAQASFVCNGHCSAPHTTASGGSERLAIDANEMVSGNPMRAGARAVDAHERPVTLICGAPRSDGSWVYLVTVDEEGWRGAWAVSQADMATKIDNNGLFQCALSYPDS
jgi:hypothetical protein